MMGVAARSDAVKSNPVRELARVEAKAKGATAIPLDELAGLLEKVRADTRLQELDANGRSRTGLAQPPEGESEVATAVSPEENDGASDSVPQEAPALTPEQVMALTRELIEIRDLLTIAEKTSLPFRALLLTARKLEDHGLLRLD